MIHHKFIAFIIIIFTTSFVCAQGFKYSLRLADSKAPLSTVYMHVSNEWGKVVNDQNQNLHTGSGFTTTALIPDNWLNNRNKNYFSLGIKGVNNVHKLEKFKFWYYMNDTIDNSFNYFQILGGYRFSGRIRDDGWYIEPRAGYILWDFYKEGFNDKGNQAFFISPTAGYVIKNLDFAIFFDYGVSQRNTNIGKKTFINLGISIGYDLGFYTTKKCRCDYYYQTN